MKNTEYQGFEVGPIRPPSEARSLMLRVTRNCPWNRCKFCGLYKDEKFSMRSVEHIIKDIDAIKKYTDLILEQLKNSHSGFMNLAKSMGLNGDDDINAFQSAMQWIQTGMDSVFLQDGNSIILKPSDLEQVLLHLRKQFPSVKRVTTYARSKNLYRMKDEDLKMLADAGLNRIHIGMESGSDPVLELVNKGVTKQEQIIAGQKVKKAGIELSVYYMPGLGGKALTRENAIDTADVFNQVNPDFIRIRTLAVPKSVDLYEDVQNGSFQKLNDIEVMEELKLFVSTLDGIDSSLMSDHILNLLQELEGSLPGDKHRMLDTIERFLAMNTQEQMTYRVGRRTGIYQKLDDVYDIELMPHVDYQIRANGVTQNNLNQFTDSMMERFI
ncbi:radical SAM protein [Vibrio harveyi]|uniref:radical SAM protein n=1 Tax=Vibrio harveyi TaxID=669 RepID=UPI001EFD52A1|nr:radical SAM protein [Vibrio harveyi]MCG9612759.1 radical SAM protein [Vibrio harveyi]MCG9671236.1 radical SAM protein [Vibrio harveyi]